MADKKRFPVTAEEAKATTHIPPAGFSISYIRLASLSISSLSFGHRIRARSEQRSMLSAFGGRLYERSEFQNALDTLGLCPKELYYYITISKNQTNTLKILLTSP